MVEFQQKLEHNDRDETLPGRFSMAWAHQQRSGPWWEVGENNKVTPPDP